ncbi:MAG: hypothetical protein WBD11_05275 [Xanthobacteraceae bacterium]|jgi:hypothetical protein
MNQPDTAPKAPKAYFASARAYALDLAATLFCSFPSASWPVESGDFHLTMKLPPFPRSSWTLSVRLSPASPQPMTSIRRCPMRCFTLTGVPLEKTILTVDFYRRKER